MKELKDYTKQDVTQVPGAFDAVVYEVKLISAKEAYPNSTYNKDGDKVISVSWENTNYNMKKTEYFPFYDEENLTDNSKMGKYLNKYITFDAPTTVQVFRNGKGYFEVQLE